MESLAAGARFNHTNLIAHDWKKLADFYCRVFGCVPLLPERNQSGEWLERGTNVRDAKLAGVHLRLPGHGENGPTLEIYTYSAIVPRGESAANWAGYGHIAFAVDDVDQALKAILSAGEPVLARLYRLKFKAPAGLPLRTREIPKAISSSFNTGIRDPPFGIGYDSENRRTDQHCGALLRENRERRSRSVRKASGRRPGDVLLAQSRNRPAVSRSNSLRGAVPGRRFAFLGWKKRNQGLRRLDFLRALSVASVSSTQARHERRFRTVQVRTALWRRRTRWSSCGLHREGYRLPAWRGPR